MTGQEPVIRYYTRNENNAVNTEQVIISHSIITNIEWLPLFYDR